MEKKGSWADTDKSQVHTVHRCAPAWDSCCVWVLNPQGTAWDSCPASGSRGLWQLWTPTFQPGLQVPLAAVALGEGLAKRQIMVKVGSPRAALPAVVVNEVVARCTFSTRWLRARGPHWWSGCSATSTLVKQPGDHPSTN